VDRKTTRKKSTLPQQSIKNIGQTEVLESLALSISLLLGRQVSAPKALRFFIQSRSQQLKKRNKKMNEQLS
jgi:hypothetical protein